MNRRELMIFSAAALAARSGSAYPQIQAQGAHTSRAGQPLPDRLLLNDWRPRSIYKIPVTEIKKAKYPVIDVHNHGVRSAEEADEMVRSMDATGVEKTVIFAGTGKPEKFAQIREIYSAHPERLELWCLFDLRGVNDHDALIENLERTVKKHARTSFIACHLLNLDYDLTRLGQILDRNPNLNVDISARMAEISTIPRFTKQFMQKYQDRLLYGTDFTYTPGELRSTFRTIETADEH